MRLRYLAVLVVCLLAGSYSLNAQILYGGLVGTVTDSTGAAVPAATVTITHEQTGASRTTTTNEVGYYSFPTIPTGTYTVRVEMEGFRTYTETNVPVTVNNVTRVDVTLELGAVTEEVTVVASAATLQTDRAEVRAEIPEVTLENIPIPLGRNYQMLFVTIPGFSPPQNRHSVPSNPSRAVAFTVNGTTMTNNNTRIDGASSTNIWLPHMIAWVPALEAIETVNVVTNSFDAEQGFAGGAAINVQIKSGTNEIHGSLFGYNTNNKIKAYPWISDRTKPKPKFIYNQFGGTIGGPIKRNKMFYFFSYEGTREHQFAERFVTVPTPEMKRGDLSASPTPIFDPFSDPSAENRTVFPGNIIPQSRWSAPVKKIILEGVEGSRWPDPNQPGQGSLGLARNYLAGGNTVFDRDTIDTKVNWNASDKLTGFIRFGFLDYRMVNPQVFGKLGGNRLHPTNSNPGNGWGNTYSGTISATYVASPTFVIDAYFGYTLMDTNVEQDLLDVNVGRDILGIPGTNGTRRFEGGWPRFRIDGFEQLGISNNFMPYYRTDPQWQYVANANWTKGSHDIRFGFDFYIQHLNHNQPEFPGSIGPAQGGFRFRQGTTSNKGFDDSDYNAFASFLLGLPREAGKIHQFPDEYTTRTKQFSAYIRDRWQVNPRLTITYGVRWEYYPFPTRKDRGLERYDLATNEILVCGVGNIPKDCGIPVSKRNFAPRVGIAYRATDKFVIRMGYGLTINPFNWARPLRTNYPIMFVQNLNAPHSRGWATTLEEGIPPIDPPDISAGRLPLPLTAAVVTADPENTKRGYVQSWNFTIERELPGGWIASAGYVATRSIRVMSSLEQNWSPIGGGRSGRVLNVKFGRSVTTRMLAHLPTWKYDSLQVRAERRFAGDYQITIGYTWSKGLGYTDEDEGDQPFFRIPMFYHRNYARLNEDRRHNFQLMFIYDVPAGKGKRFLTSGPLAHILGGWQFNGLFSAYTGEPVSVRASSSSLNSSGQGQVADCLAPPRKIGRPEMWYDPSSFAPVTEQRFGTCGLNILDAPGLINLDLGVFKKFQISERVQLQFRAEAFNVSNTPHFRAPNTNISSSSFGVITGEKNIGREGRNERVFRLGLRLQW